MTSFLALLTGISIWQIAKALILIALLIYAIFALVVVRQVYAMTKVVSGELDQALKIIVWIHFIITLLVIGLALVVL